jgi:hypothetical protein
VGKFVSATDNKGDINTNTMGLAAVAAVLSGQLYNYFCSPGIILGEDFNTMPGFNTVGKLVSKLPQDICKGKLHHSGTRWDGVSVFGATGEFRLDGRVTNDGSFAYAAYGPERKVRVPIERSFVGTIINPTSLEETNISGNAGNYLPEFAIEDGFVIHGYVK